MRTITAMFDDRADAEAARSRLANAGISEDQVSIHDQSSLGNHDGDRGSDYSGSTGGAETVRDAAHDAANATANAGHGLWSQIKSFFSGDEGVYEEGMRRGGYLLTARVDEGMVRTATDILDDEGTVDLDQRQQNWRNEGWTGNSDTMGTSGALGAAAGMGAAATGMGAGSGMGDTGGMHAASGMAPDRDRMADRDEVIPLVEEQLRVGKRDVSHGSVRVRSYVVETPVSEQVTLHSERVDVDRRPVSGEREVAPGELEGMLRDRTIEARETSEEAVVDKRAVVREEVAITRHGDDRVETVSDTVRRTEVDIDRDGDRDGRMTDGTERR